ncbi:MAG: hypothetical protein AB1847_15630 [bacterium]
MRWLITAICVSLLMTSSLCEAQAAENSATLPPATVMAASRVTPTKATVLKATEAKVLVGKITAITLADSAQNIKPQIVVRDKNDRAVTLLVTSTTDIYDVGWNAVALGDLKVGSKSRVKYSTPEDGTNEALSINIIK